MKVYNVARSVGTITGTVRNSGCTHSNVNCTYCPKYDDMANYCLATCDIGNWVDKSTNPDTCTACDASCVDQGAVNCVRAGKDHKCTLCSEYKCLTCNYFYSGTSGYCNSCITNGAFSGSRTCVCDSNHVLAEPPTYATYECTCHANCNTCETLDEYRCKSCPAGRYWQPNNIKLCLEFCPWGFTASGTTCNNSPGDSVFVLKFDTIPDPIPTAAS
jgi:hypothetical protein